LQLHAICSRLWLSLGVFSIIRSNFKYFGHFYNYNATIENFILWVGWLLGWFSNMNILIHPIRCNNHQISHILKVFYGDIGLYFYVYVLKLYLWYITYIINTYLCVLITCMYVYCSYNELKINISVMKCIHIWILKLKF